MPQGTFDFSHRSIFNTISAQYPLSAKKFVFKIFFLKLGIFLTLKNFLFKLYKTCFELPFEQITRDKFTFLAFLSLVFKKKTKN